MDKRISIVRVEKSADVVTGAFDQIDTQCIGSGGDGLAIWVVPSNGERQGYIIFDQCRDRGEILEQAFIGIRIAAHLNAAGLRAR